MRIKLFAFALAFCFVGSGLAASLTGEKSLAGPVAQNESAKTACDQTRALLLIQQQVDEARSLDKPNKQIPILIRAAHLLWPRRQENARAIFANALDLAEKHFKEKGDESREEGLLTIRLEDQRFAVMHAIAQHDAAWSKRLAERVAEETQREAAKTESRGYSPSMSEKLLNLATRLAPVDQAMAIGIARSTLRHPATPSAQHFIFTLAETNQRAADQFYEEALAANANSPIPELLYLSAYPFGSVRIIGPEALSTGFIVPPAFMPNPRLQQLLLDALIRRAEAVVKAPDQSKGNINGMSAPAQLLIAFNKLETVLPQFQPAYLERVISLKYALNQSLGPDARNEVAEVWQWQTESNDGKEFERNLEKAEREKNPVQREQYLAFAVLSMPDSESLDRLIGIVQKINDLKVREQLMNYAYFARTQKAIKDGSIDDATRLAGKVGQVDLRAYLSYEVAAASLKDLQDRSRAREILDDAQKIASKAPNTNEKARALLGIAHLYAKFDSIRAFEVMSEAVKTINRISEPDFSSTFLLQRIEGNGFGHYSSYDVEGFSIENAFRLLAPYDFDGALLLAKYLEDKLLRAMATLALSAACSENLEDPQKQDESKKPAKPAASDDKKRNP
jgi:hypothetical protein